MRDAKGRFVTSREYRMMFDDGHVEDVRAWSPHGAVMRRRGSPFSMLPHTIIDRTALDRWEASTVLSRSIEVVNRPAEPGPIAQRVASARTDLVPVTPHMSTLADWREEWDD